ncbi:MAG TPA: type III-B CRISPR module-associated protein Cmr3 [Chloroflexia bacterium]|nr:type III-B CRISPR module-associated protein Cmr3 [Chloroflexia bacterium]
MAESWQTWIIEPRDPLIARDGRPFGPTPGARAASLPFPFPSTTTGGVRTRAGLDAQGRFVADPQQVRQIAVRGPLLVELDGERTIRQWLAPAPADALLVETRPGQADPATRQWLRPILPDAGAHTNLPGGTHAALLADLLPVGPAFYNPNKAAAGVPRFWYWDVFQAWLQNPADGAQAHRQVRPDQAASTLWVLGPPDQPAGQIELGHSGPHPEQRLHVGIDPGTLASREGALFQTRGLEFTGPDRRRLALAVTSDGTFPHAGDGFAPLGGERRLVSWRASTAPLPACPPAIRQAVVDRKACRVVLLTPAVFAAGFYPTTLLQPGAEVSCSLRGVVCGRPQVVSGWDFAYVGAGGSRGQPKPSRRLAPAGSVLFLQLAGSPQAIGRWVDDHWMQCVSDDDQDRRDGFGLAAIGTWDEPPGPMQFAPDRQEDSR